MGLASQTLLGYPPQSRTLAPPAHSPPSSLSPPPHSSPRKPQRRVPLLSLPSLSSLPLLPSPLSWSKQPSVAVCLAGGLRMFELTWPSIERHLLATYAPCDLFVRAPVDADAHKITLAGRQSPYVRHVSIWLDPQVPLESSVAKQVLKTAGSPQGLQVGRTGNSASQAQRRGVSVLRRLKMARCECFKAP